MKLLLIWGPKRNLKINYVTKYVIKPYLYHDIHYNYAWPTFEHEAALHESYFFALIGH
jgi:hypothetical protein